MLYACLATYTTEEQSHDAGASWRAGHRATISLVPPVRYARIGGALYLVIIVAGIVGPLLTRDRLIVAGDAAASVQNIAHCPNCGDLA